MVRWTAAFVPLKLDYRHRKHHAKAVLNTWAQTENKKAHFNLLTFYSRCYSVWQCWFAAARLFPSATSEHDLILFSQPSLPSQFHLQRPADSFRRVSECPVTSQQHFKNKSFLDNSKAASQGSTGIRPVGPIAEAHKILKQYQQHPRKKDWGTLP